MLDFTDKEKISYAASFGPKRKSAERLTGYQKYLKEFNRVSVREKLAQDICIKDLGIPAEVVCDPVFLLEEAAWRTAAVEYSGRPERYILCYFPGGVPREMELFSQKIADEQGCARVLLMPEWRNSARLGIKAYDCGPGEFLDLILHADSICTSSFHGAAFSTLFQKDFYVFRTGNDCRIESLLNNLEGKWHDQYAEKIWSVHARKECSAISEDITASKKFLNDVLRGG